MLKADLIGFHTYDYARHFVSACTRILGLEVGIQKEENTLLAMEMYEGLMSLQCSSAAADCTHMPGGGPCAGTHQGRVSTRPRC